MRQSLDFNVQSDDAPRHYVPLAFFWGRGVSIHKIVYTRTVGLVLDHFSLDYTKDLCGFVLR